jgi:putative flippase GtrA
VVIASLMVLRTLPKSSIIAAAVTALITFVSQKSTTVRDSSEPFGSVRRLNHPQFAQWVSATLEYGASRQYLRILMNPSVPVPVKFRMQGTQRRAWGHVNAWWTTPVVLAAVIGVLVLFDRYPELIQSAPSWPAAIALGGFTGGAYGRFWRWQRTPRQGDVLTRSVEHALR